MPNDREIHLHTARQVRGLDAEIDNTQFQHRPAIRRHSEIKNVRARRMAQARQLRPGHERASIDGVMARLRIPIFFDYASTLCYIAWRIVRELEGELGFEALWKGGPIAL